MTWQRFCCVETNEVALFLGSLRKRRRKEEHMRRLQLRPCKRQTAGIDMHPLMRHLYVVLPAQAVSMAGDVVSCSLPVTACSSFAVRRVVCRYIRIMACGMSPFCDATSNVVALLRTRHAVHGVHSRDTTRKDLLRRGEKYSAPEVVGAGVVSELGCEMKDTPGLARR